jgi:deoxyribose-phosphate aldolase
MTVVAKKAVVVAMDTGRIDVDLLVEEITREVLGLLREGGAGLPGVDPMCLACQGQCIGKCSEKVRNIVEAGASRVGAGLGVSPVARELAQYIDHTLLRPEANRDQITQLCQEALQYGFAAVCINPTWVRLCAELLRGSPVKVCTVVGFPLGATLLEVKAYEARRSVRNGAEEIDMVINIGALKSRDYALVQDDIEAVVMASEEGGAICKVIVEAALLTDEEKIKACTLAKAAGAQYVKTSTGFGPGGATTHDVALMRQIVGREVGVKAAGGVRTLEDAKSMIAAGATRIGASASVKIMQEAARK